MRSPVVALVLAQALAASTLGAQAPTPESHFGFRMGGDRRLAAIAEIEAYFELLAARTDRVKVVDIGPTTEGHKTIAAIVSAPENIRNLDQIRATNQRLADPRTFPLDEARRAAVTHKAVLAIGCCIHAAEIGGSQAANELLYSLATANDSETLEVLQNVVVILIPSLNPDGHRMVVDWHEKTKDTPFAGTPPPGLTHKYVGHDINRDAFMMNLAESRNLARFFYSEWHPHVFLSLHQMGSDGPRMFVPPMADPIDPNYDPVIWREAALLGSAMALELQRDGRSGVVSRTLYDYYSPGYEDSAPLGHNTVSLLAEVAGAESTAPIAAANGDSPARPAKAPAAPGIDAPDPWPGGTWTLRNVVEYELSAARGLLHAVAAYRERIIANFYDMGARAIEAGGRGDPFAFVIPPDQFDPRAVAKLEELLLQGAIEIHRAVESFAAGGTTYPAGSDIILLAQPYRAYVKTLFETQSYPAPARRPSPAATPEGPYDVAGWTLPAQMGVDVRTISNRFEPPVTSRLTRATIPRARVWGERKPSFYIIDARGNGGAIAVNRLVSAGATLSWITGGIEVDGYKYAPGSLVVARSKTVQPIVESIAATLGLRATGVKRKPGIAMVPVGAGRVGLYKPWVESSDEGWTRWLLEQHEFKFGSLSDADIRAGSLRRRYDAIVLPSASAGELMAGHTPGSVPAEYAGGLGEPGIAALRAFVDAGGTLVCLGQAGALAIERFKLSLRDVAREASPGTFFGPGSIVRLDLDMTQPAAYGMKAQTAAFFAFSSAYDVGSGTNIRVGARYATTDLLLSGWLEGEQTIAGRPAVVDVSAGATTGRVVLLGFPVQHRAQSHATFRLLFNALLTAR